MTQIHVTSIDTYIWHSFLQVALSHTSDTNTCGNNLHKWHRLKLVPTHKKHANSHGLQRWLLWAVCTLWYTADTTGTAWWYRLQSRHITNWGHLRAPVVSGEWGGGDTVGRPQRKCQVLQNTLCNVHVFVDLLKEKYRLSSYTEHDPSIGQFQVPYTLLPGQLIQIHPDLSWKNSALMWQNLFAQTTHHCLQPGTYSERQRQHMIQTQVILTASPTV